MVVSSHHRADVGDVDRMAQGLTERLDALDLATGSVVALAAPNGPAFLAGLLAVRRARCAALLYDWQAPAAETARIGRALHAAALLTCRRTWPQRPEDFTVEPTAAETTPVSPDVAVVKLTSGSTGCPRGILTPSSALVADDEALAATMELRPDERILAAIPMSHSYGLSSVVMPALMRRALLVVAPEHRGPFDPTASAREHDVTFFPTAPAFLNALVKMAKPPSLPDSLRLVVTAGGPLSTCAATAFRTTYGRSVHVFYGASECGGIAFDRTGTAGERGTVGTPVEGATITLEAIPGIEDGGAVTVESAAVAAGYTPDAEPSLGDGRFRTRDLATWKDGELTLAGRHDDLINVRGRKVNPREVERVLESLEGIDEVVVVGAEPPGRNGTVVRSFIVSRSREITRTSVQAWCRRHLAGYKIPRSIVLVDEIPRTGRGKLDRAALLAHGAGEPTRHG